MAQSRNVPFLLFAVLILLGVAAFFVWPTFAQNMNEAEKKAAAEAKTKDPYAVPDGTPKELVKFIRGVANQLSEKSSLDEKEFKRGLLAILKAAEKALDAEKIKPEVRLEAMRWKISVLLDLRGRGDKTAESRLKKFLTAMSRDKDEGVSELAVAHLLLLRVQQVDALKDKQREQLSRDLLAYPSSDKLQSRVGTAIKFGELLEAQGRNEMAGKLFQTIARRVAKSKDERLAALAPQFEGFARRATLVGSELNIKGKTVDGKEFHWGDYKGKVVLVDFWATWCRPCLAALPGVRKHYDEFHSRGFEVVGISLDRRPDVLQDFIKETKLPWTTLFSGDPEATGFNHPMATYYGVMAIPMTILVGRDGKVVALNVHGPQLGRMLPGLLNQKAAKASPAPRRKAVAAPPAGKRGT